MKKISGSTFYFKKIFPTIWFGFLAFFLSTSFREGTMNESFMLLAISFFMAVLGYLFFKNNLWNLADEVFDDGGSLLFYMNGKEQRVKLSEIININHTQMGSVERVVLKVRAGGAVGSELAFTPPMRFNPFSKNAMITDLIERVDRARTT